jgi:hypothetical protein
VAIRFVRLVEDAMKNKNRSSWCAIAVVTLALSSAREARADDCDGEADNPRTLCGHQYVPSSLVEWGFITSTIASTSSLGVAHFDLDRSGIVAREITREAKLIALAQTFSGGVAFTPWLGASARLTGSGLIPRDAASALAIGAHENLGGDGSVSIALVRSPAFLLTATATAGYSANRDLVPAFFPNNVLQTGNVTILRPALIAILAVTPTFGLQASGSYMWQWIDVNVTSHVQTVRGAVAATIALHPVTILIGGAITQGFGDDPSTTPALEFLTTGGLQGWGEAGIYYTGRRDLDLGAVFTAEIGSNQDDQRFITNLRLGYYF